MNIPNSLTILRIALIPFFVVFMLADIGKAGKYIALVISASYWGKAKTISQMIMIILLILDWGGIFNILETIFVWLALILTIVSLIDYIIKNRKVLSIQN